MRKQHFNLLLVIVALVLLMSSWLVSQKAGDGLKKGSLLFPELKGQLAKVSGVTVKGAGDTTFVELERQVDKEGEVSWSVTNRDGYPGNFNQLKNLLVSLADTKLQESKTKNPQNYANLGVRDISDAESEALLLSLTFDDGLPPISLLVGKSAEKWKGQYIRFPDLQQSWLTDKHITLEKEATDWLRRNIINISSARIQSVSYTNPKGSKVEVAKTAGENDDFLIQNIPNGRELSYEAIGNTIASAISYVKLDDVLREGVISFKPELTYNSTFRTNNGLVVSAQTTKVDDKAYVKFSVDVDQALVKDQQALVDPFNEADEQSQAANMAVDNETHETSAEDEAEKLQHRASGWVFQISDFAYGSFTKEMDSLLKAEDEPEKSDN